MALYNTAGGASAADAGGTTRDSSSIAVPTGAVMYAMAVSSDVTAVDCTGVSLDPTGTPQAFTQLGSTLNLNSNARASLWRLTNPSSVTAVVRATWGSNQTERSIVVWVGTEISLSTPNETPVTATGTDTTPTATASTGVVSGDLCLAFACYQWGTNSPIAFNSPSGTERGEYTGANYSGVAVLDQAATGSSISPQWTLGTTPTNWGIFVLALNDGGALEQEGFRYGNDDNSEGAHSWKADQDVNINLDAGQTALLNIILNATGAVSPKRVTLQHRKVGDALYIDTPLE